MTKEIFIQKFTDTVQYDINNIKKIARKTENKLFILSSILFIVVFGTLFLVNYFDIHIIFFIMTLFVSIMVYYVGTYTFKYEYHDLLQKDIFPKIARLLINNNRFIINNYLEDDAKASDIFSLYDYKLATVSIQSKWSIDLVYENHQVLISSIYLSYSDIINPALPFADNKHGLFVTIDDINMYNSEIYILKKSLFLSLKGITHILKKDFYNDNSIDERYIVVSKRLNQESKKKIFSLINSFHEDVTITLKNNKMYIFIETEFSCFDVNHYENGKLPSYYDYIGFLDIENSIKLAVTVCESKEEL